MITALNYLRMRSGKNLTILNKIKQFTLLDNFADIGSADILHAYYTNGFATWVQRIEFNDDRENVPTVIDLSGITDNTRIDVLNSKNFKNCFYELCTLFEIDYVKKVIDYGILTVDNKEKIAGIAIKPIAENLFYLVLFWMDDGESRRNSCLYVHDIFKVKGFDE